MKKLVFKKNVQLFVEFMISLSLFLIVCTIDSEWSSQYFLFLIVNMVILGVNTYLLNKFGKYEED